MRGTMALALAGKQAQSGFGFFRSGRVAAVLAARNAAQRAFAAAASFARPAGLMPLFWCLRESGWRFGSMLYRHDSDEYSDVPVEQTVCNGR